MRDKLVPFSNLAQAQAQAAKLRMALTYGGVSDQFIRVSVIATGKRYTVQAGLIAELGNP
ncbi:MAG: hypothetical protein JSS77_16130 [Acidobacteria bacterium]|nr:hypothetical protein [Acidobacteriota bacterium]